MCHGSECFGGGFSAFSINFMHLREKNLPPLCRIDPYGFERPHDFDSYKEMMNDYVAILNRRSMRWSKLLQDKPNVEKNLTGTEIISNYTIFVENLLK